MGAKERAGEGWRAAVTLAPSATAHEQRLSRWNSREALRSTGIYRAKRGTILPRPFQGRLIPRDERGMAESLGFLDYGPRETEAGGKEKPKAVAETDVPELNWDYGSV